VADPGETAIPGARFAALRAAIGRLAAPTFFILAFATLVVVAGIGGYVARTGEVDRLDRQLSALSSEVGGTNDLAELATARVLELTDENSRLAADLDASTDLSTDLAARLANVEAAVQSTTDLETSLEALVAERDQLRESMGELTGAYDLQANRLDELGTIESFGPIGNPLLFDDATDAWVTQPVCTGSMEPSIGCEDLLVVYRPTITDLDVGDIIIFRRPDATCEGFVSGSFLLHRITRVVSSSADGGLAFETKGDANFSIDPCRAPVASVTGKVLAVIQNSRLPG
jgi:signal peptidase I